MNVAARLAGAITLFALTQTTITDSAAAQDIVRPGNLKFAHCVKEVAKDCGIAVEERTLPKGPDVRQTIHPGEIDVDATASEAAISDHAAGAPKSNRREASSSSPVPGSRHSCNRSPGLCQERPDTWSSAK